MKGCIFTLIFALCIVAQVQAQAHIEEHGDTLYVVMKADVPSIYTGAITHETYVWSWQAAEFIRTQLNQVMGADPVTATGPHDLSAAIKPKFDRDYKIGMQGFKNMMIKFHLIDEDAIIHFRISRADSL